MKSMMLIGLGLMAASCTTIGGPGVSSYFDCGNGAMLKVTYTRGGAIVEKGGGPPIALRSVPSTGANTFENRMGMRLSVMGDRATFTGRTREAPQSCRRVVVPR